MGSTIPLWCNIELNGIITPNFDSQWPGMSLRNSPARISVNAAKNGTQTFDIKFRPLHTASPPLVVTAAIVRVQREFCWGNSSFFIPAHLTDIDVLRTLVTTVQGTGWLMVT